ncbi:MAG: glycosyltransferase [Pseudomonadota bacterium]|nr:glycosyltransferase [Pseudomonadota bacterium]
MVSVSVLMPAFNAERTVRQAINSVLAQTFEDFELLVVNDGSDDGTAAILDSIADPRLRVITNPRNLGIVGAANRGAAMARGRYIARLDADDIARPTRLARQVSFLDRHPDILLLGTEMTDLERGQMRPSRRLVDTDPVVLRWLMHLGNPIGHSTMIFRADVLDRLGGYMRAAFPLADDFDFAHRVLRLGAVAMLPERLVVYRRHAGSLTQRREAELIGLTTAVLSEAYRPLLNDRAPDIAALVARHLMAGVPPDGAALARLGAGLDALLDAYLAQHECSPAQWTAIEAHAVTLWWRAVQSAMRSGRVTESAGRWRCFPKAMLARPKLHELSLAALSGSIPHKARMRRALDQQSVTMPESPEVIVAGSRLTPLPENSDDPPILYVVVDTEAEFNWGQPFTRSLISVSAISAQERAQALFDSYGLRPIYAVDYPVASQPDGYEPLRRIFERKSCVIGAHLHPWVNPPPEEPLTEHHSFAGNLTPELEERKLKCLVQAIENAFSVKPLFFKAGRYGVGPNTFAILQRLGFEVDFSILPLADLRPRGGADFRRAQARPYRVGATGPLTVPMTRAEAGLLAPLPRLVRAALQFRMAKTLRLPSIFSRLGLVNTVTLTPEGVTAREQIALLRRMVRRGHRTFVLHYHSPSLAPGHTPYVRTEADLRQFLNRLERVCAFFLQTLGGLPGNPADLLPSRSRQLVWPQLPLHLVGGGASGA